MDGSPLRERKALTVEVKNRSAAELDLEPGAETRPPFSIIMPIRNCVESLAVSLPRALSAVEAYGNAELILVDNGSTDGSFEYASERVGDRAKVHRLEEGTIAAVRNYGARSARGEHLYFLDADCLIGEEHLSRALEILRSLGVAATGARIDIPEDSTRVQETWYRLHRPGADGYVNFLGSGNFVVRRDVFEQVNGFDENLVTGEDAELCQRLRKRGHRIYEARELAAVHLGEARTLGQFFRKQRWYALGMFGTVKGSVIDKPTAMMFMHLLLIGLGVATLVTAPFDWGMNVLLAISSLLLVPALSVGYRWAQIGRMYRPFHSLLLYELFYAARISALALIVLGSRTDWRA